MLIVVLVLVWFVNGAGSLEGKIQAGYLCNILTIAGKKWGVGCSPLWSEPGIRFEYQMSLILPYFMTITLVLVYGNVTGRCKSDQ